MINSHCVVSLLVIRPFRALSTFILPCFIALPLLFLTACGGNSPSGTPAPVASNSVPLSVDTTAYSNLNMLTPSVTLCSPAAPTSCQTIDHILVDTGSVGLRVFASALDPSINLPQQISSTSGGNPVAECFPFASGYTWGAVKLANLQLGAETANNMAIQVMGDASYPIIPTGCSNFGQSLNSASILHANGILGVGLFRQDCKALCTNPSYTVNIYYVCSTSACNSINQNLADQLQNPVSLFGTDNNGVIIQLNPIVTPQNGQLDATGALIFGVDTKANNGSANTTTLFTDANGMVTTFYKGQIYSDSFFDSGSNTLAFNDPSITQCATTGPQRLPGFYCPGSQLLLTAMSAGTDNVTSNVINFSVDNAARMIYGSPFSFAAFTNIAAPAWNDSVFDWGLPFYYGNTVYTVMENATTTKGNGPYFGW